MPVDSVDAVDAVEQQLGETSLSGNTYGADASILGPTQVVLAGTSATNKVSMKQYDTLPLLGATLQDVSGNPVDVTGATIKFHMRLNGATTAAVNAAAVIIDATAGQVAYEWAANDLAITGEYSAEFTVIFADGGRLSFPNTTEFSVFVEGAVATP